MRSDNSCLMHRRLSRVGIAAARRLTPERLSLYLVALAGLIALWNASTYPAGAGYDAASHREYGDFLINHLRLPHENETPEYYSPPLYYLLAGGVTWIGREAGIGEPHKLAQLLNVPAVVGTALLVGALARLLWPERRWIAPAAIGYVALSPVLMRTASMFNPEPTDLLRVGALPLPRGAPARRPPLRPRARRSGSALALGAGEMVRQFSLWTLAVVVLAFLAALWWRRGERRALMRTLALALAGCVVVAGPWYGYRAANYSNAIFDRPPTSTSRCSSGGRRASTSTRGCRTSSRGRTGRTWSNLAGPQTYSDIWGDWYGVFAWSAKTEANAARAIGGWLSLQNVLGLVPTALAVVGWLVLLGRSLRRRDAPRLLVGAAAARRDRRLPLLHGQLPDARRRRPEADVHALDARRVGALLRLARRPARRARRRGSSRWRSAVLALSILPFLVYKGVVGWV